MKLKFKAGDIVRCIDNGTEKYKGHGWKKDWEFVISYGKVFNDKNGNVYFPKNESGIYEHSLELVSSEPNYEIY